MIKYLAVTLNRNGTRPMYKYFKDEGGNNCYETSGEFCSRLCRSKDMTYEINCDRIEGLTVITDPKEIAKLLMTEELLR